MRNWRKKPRTFNPNEVWGEEKKLCKKASAIENAWLSTVKTLKTDPLEFFRQVLGVEPTDYQKELIELFQKNQFVAARWSRQSGKSFTTSGMLLYYALVNANVYIGVIGPSWRQTKFVIRRIGDFARRLPTGSKIIIKSVGNGKVIRSHS